MQHVPYIPQNWNKLLLCIGYSHHGKGVDYPQFTEDLLRDVVNSDRLPTFFARISSYFGKSAQEFWPHVAFLNFLPRAVGDSNQKYLTAYHMHEEARLRTEAFLRIQTPARAIVFSTKAWRHFCLSDEEKRGGRCPVLVKSANRAHTAETGNYTVGSTQIKILGLPHPERANKSFMRDAVNLFLGQNYLF